MRSSGSANGSSSTGVSKRPVRRRPVVEDDGRADRGRARPRDPDRLGRDPVGLGGRELVARREAPGPVDDHPDAEALALAAGDALDPARLDVDGLLEPPDHAHVGVRRPQGSRRVEGTAGQIAHRARGYRARPARCARAWAVSIAGAGQVTLPARRQPRPAAASAWTESTIPIAEDDDRGTERDEASQPSRAAARTGPRSSAPRASTTARPIPVMTAAIPTPNAATRTTPQAGRPAAIVPRRIRRRAGRRDEAAGEAEEERGRAS